MVTFVALVTIFGGIFVDSLAQPWSRAAADVWAWSTFAWLIRRADSTERRQLIWCVIIASLGEWFLGFVWGLYEYRLGNLPLFIPPGHAVVYAAGRRLRQFVPARLAPALAVGLGIYSLVAAPAGWDTQAPLWYLLVLGYLLWGSPRNLYSTMFLLAFCVEAFGTSVGGWRYMPRDPWFGLSTVTRPPLWVGSFYCTLDALVMAASGTRFLERMVSGNLRRKTAYFST